MAELRATGGSKPVLEFVLVHGTFGRDAAWVVSEAPGSFRDQIRRSLAGDYDIRFEVVDWGERGRLTRYLFDNMHRRRLAGAAALKDHLRRCDDVSAVHRRYLVAHSHGGNVVMYALDDPDVRSKTSGVICLSSPFLEYHPAQFNTTLLYFSAATTFFIALGPPAGLPAALSTALWPYAIVYILVVASLYAARTLGDSPESLDRIYGQAARVRIPAREQFRNAAGEIPFLAVRPHRDEVAGLFWLTQHAGRAFRALWQFVNRIGGLALLAFFGVRAIEWGVGTVLPQLDVERVDRAMSLIDKFLMTPIMLFASVVLLGMVLMRLSYALDSLPWLPRLDLRPRIVPWDEADAVAVDTFGLLAHTSMQIQSPPKIADWIRSSHSVDPAARIARPRA